MTIDGKKVYQIGIPIHQGFRGIAEDEERNARTLVNRLSDETLMKMVRLGIERARSYDFTWESSITAFIVLMFKVAPNFDQHPLIARALKDARFAPEERVEKIWERVTSKNWEAAREDYDPRAWQLKPEER